MIKLQPKLNDTCLKHRNETFRLQSKNHSLKSSAVIWTSTFISGSCNVSILGFFTGTCII